MVNLAVEGSIESKRLIAEIAMSCILSNEFGLLSIIGIIINRFISQLGQPLQPPPLLGLVLGLTCWTAIP